MLFLIGNTSGSVMLNPSGFCLILHLSFKKHEVRFISLLLAMVIGAARVLLWESMLIPRLHPSARLVCAPCENLILSSNPEKRFPLPLLSLISLKRWYVVVWSINYSWLGGILDTNILLRKIIWIKKAVRAAGIRKFTLFLSVAVIFAFFQTCDRWQSAQMTYCTFYLNFSWSNDAADNSP